MAKTDFKSVTEYIASRPKHVQATLELVRRTIRFPLSEPVPVKLIEGIAKLRAKKVAER